MDEHENEFVDIEDDFQNIEINEKFASTLDDDQPYSQLHFPPNKHDLWLTLENIYHGCVIDEKVEYKIYDNEGYCSETEEQILQIKVKPGSIEGTEYVFEKQGDKLNGDYSVDVIFTVREKLHAFFQRKDLDIVYTAYLTTQEAILGCELKVPTLDGSEVTCKVKGRNIVPETGLPEERMQKCGLPKLDSEEMSGDLVVQFKISDEMKDQPIIRDLPLTLDEIFNGIEKIIDIERKILDSNGNFKIVTINPIFKIQPGTPVGTRYLVHRGGDENLGRIAADIIYITSDLPHPKFLRKGSNLEHFVDVTKVQIDRKEKLTIPTLSKEFKILALSKNMIKEKCYQQLGLPFLNKPNVRGDLIVHVNFLKDLDIVFDINVTLESILRRSEIVKINRKIFDSSGVETFKEIIKEIKIKLNTVDGEILDKCIEMGDESATGHIPADIVFVARIVPDENFSRNGSDIVHKVLLASRELLNGITLKIPTLDKDEIVLDRIDKDLIIDKPLIFPGRGLPVRFGKRGNLLVYFGLVDDTKKDPDIEHQIPVTLEQVLNGCSKEIKLTRKVKDRTGNEIEKSEIVKFYIRPGTVAGQKFTFPRMANQRHGFIAGDVVFIVTDQPHDTFTRSGADLVLVLKNVLSIDDHIYIPTLESENEQVKVDRVEDDGTRVIAGRGLPYPNEPNLRGDILIKIDCNSV